MSAETGSDDLALSAFRPRRALRLPCDRRRATGVACVSSHEHLGPVFGGDWAQRPVAELLRAMDDAGHRDHRRS